MNIEEKARSSPDVDLARQSGPGVYRFETGDLEPADELTPEGEFPEYGDFLQVTERRGGTRFIECPAALAEWLVEQEPEPGGFWFRIQTVQKVDGEWQYHVEQLDDEEREQVEEQLAE